MPDLYAIALNPQNGSVKSLKFEIDSQDSALEALTGGYLEIPWGSRERMAGV
jgi:hypothetical protein